MKLDKFASAYSKVVFGMFVISHLNVSQGPSSQETDGALTSENIGKFVYKGANDQSVNGVEEITGLCRVQGPTAIELLLPS